MMEIFWFVLCGLLWLIGLSLLAEIWFSEEEEQM
jgi:hypothetical protein